MTREHEPEDPESEYSKFVVSDHHTGDASSDIPKSLGTLVTYANKKLPKEKEAERSRISRTVLRTLLARAPMTTKYEEVRDVIKSLLDDRVHVSMVSEEAKKKLETTFGLTICDVRLPNGKRELFLKQTLSFEHHDLKVTSEADHVFRGFLLLLAPCFKAYTSGMPLIRLFEVLRKVGKGHLVPQDNEGQEALASQIRHNRKRKDMKYSASCFVGLEDYLMHAKELGYIRIQEDPCRGTGIAAVVILPGYRLAIEFDEGAYFEKLTKLNMAPNLRRSIEYLFGDT